MTLPGNRRKKEPVSGIKCDEFENKQDADETKNKMEGKKENNDKEEEQ